MITSRIGRFVLLAALAFAAASSAACTVEEASASAPRSTKKKKNGSTTRPETTADDDESEGDDDDDDVVAAGNKPTAPGVPTTPASTTPDTPAKPLIDSTNGTGGPTGQNTLKSAGGLSYMINAPAGTGAHGLLVLLHGSGASNYANFVNMMATVSQQHDLIPVSVLAPNGKGWNEGDQVNAAKLLNDLIQTDLFPKYNIDKKRVLFSGQSSGGGFLSSHFVPTYGKGYKGGAFLQCGMAAPRVTFTPDAAMKESFKLHFEITTGDTIWPQSYQQALTAYTGAGIQFTKQDNQPGGHCQFDQQKIIQDRIGFILGTAK